MGLITNVNFVLTVLENQKIIQSFGHYLFLDSVLWKQSFLFGVLLKTLLCSWKVSLLCPKKSSHRLRGSFFIHGHQHSLGILHFSMAWQWLWDAEHVTHTRECHLSITVKGKMAAQIIKAFISVDYVSVSADRLHEWDLSKWSQLCLSSPQQNVWPLPLSSERGQICASVRVCVCVLVGLQYHATLRHFGHMSLRECVDIKWL